MRKPLIFLVATLALLLIAGLTFWFVQKKQSTTIPGNTLFPSGQTGGGPSQPGDLSFSLPSESGEMLSTRNFLANGVTIEDPANVGNYYLAGSSGACTPEGDCPTAGTAEGFTIVYFSTTQSFVVGLTREPLGQGRLQAEQYLTNALGISTSDMCTLKYDVMTTSYVNEQYAGIDLGFSFCPGAVTLP